MNVVGKGAEIMLTERCCCCFELKDGIVCLSTYVMLRALLIILTSIIPPLVVQDNGEAAMTSNKTLLGLYGANLLISLFT